MKRPPIKLTPEVLALGKRYQELKAQGHVFHAAALMNQAPEIVCRGLDAIRTGEQPEPENDPNPPKEAA